MRRIRPPLAGLVSTILGLSLVASVPQAAVAAPSVAPVRKITVSTQTKVEMVRYLGGTTDRTPPFKPLVAGDAAFIRVKVLTDAAPLPGGVTRLRLQFGRDLADATIRMAERDGVRRCVRIDETVVSCVVDRVRRDDEASMLVKVVIPSGLEATDLYFRGTVVPTGDLVLKAQPTYARLKVVGKGAWSGTWHWYATWSTGAWDGNGMQIHQVRDSGMRVVCARWPWSGGGVAWGTVNELGEWNAAWRDGFGEGNWTLKLDGPHGFAGKQRVYVHGGGAFVADITGKRTGETAPELDCDAAYEEVA